MLFRNGLDTDPATCLAQAKPSLFFFYTTPFSEALIHMSLITQILGLNYFCIALWEQRNATKLFLAPALCFWQVSSQQWGLALSPSSLSPRQVCAS